MQMNEDDDYDFLELMKCIECKLFRNFIVTI